MKPKQPDSVRLSTTREEVAHRRYAESVERLRKLEREVEQAFAAEREAADELAREGVVVNVQLRPTLEGARRIWKSESRIPDGDPFREAPLGAVDEHGVLQLRRAER